MTFLEMAQDVADRLIRIFTRDQASGRRPVFGGSRKFQEDPHWRDCLLFYEYFHGDNGAGLGASHQTGWTGLIAALMDLFGRFEAHDWLETDFRTFESRLVREQVGGDAAGRDVHPAAADRDHHLNRPLPTGRARHRSRCVCVGHRGRPEPPTR